MEKIRSVAGGLRDVAQTFALDEAVRFIVENSLDCIALCDLSLRVVYANPRFDLLSGYETSQYLGRKPTELLCLGEHSGLVEERMHAAIELGTPQEVDFDWRVADGRTLPHSLSVRVHLDPTGRPAGVLAIARDIAAHRHAQSSMDVPDRDIRWHSEGTRSEVMRWGPSGQIRCVDSGSERAEPGTIAKALEEQHCGGDADGSLVVSREAVTSVACTEQMPMRDEATGHNCLPRGTDGDLHSTRSESGGVEESPDLVINAAADRQCIEGVWKFVTQHAWSGSDAPFFPSLVTNLGEALDLDFVFVARLSETSPNIAETVAGRASGEAMLNLSFELEGTPCKTVVSSRLLRSYKQGVRTLFPRSALLSELQVESYIGVPLLDATGEVVGFIVAMGRSPMANEKLVSTALRLVVARASTELIRERAALALQASEREFRSLAENSPNFIVRYNSQAQVLYANPATVDSLRIPLHKLLGKTPSQKAAHRYRTQFGAYQEDLCRVLVNGNATDSEIVISHRTVEEKVVHIRTVAIRTPSGSIDGALAIGRDITQSRKAETALRRREQEFRTLVENSPDLIERYDHQCRRTYINPALRDLLRHSGAAQVGVLERDRVAIIEAERYMRMIRSVLSTGRSKQAELRYYLAGGATGWIDVRLCPETDAQENVVSVFVVARDITQSVKQRDHIRELALSDPLTRLHNRQALYDLAPGLITEARRRGLKLGVMILDLDRFKYVNDTLGHLVGDQLLFEVSRRIAGCTRSFDLLVRLGGDEFAIVAVDLRDELDVAEIARKIEVAMSDPIEIREHQMVVSVSAGIAMYPGDGLTLEELMANADAAMYQAKRGGRSRYEFYRAEFSTLARQRLALEQALREAKNGAGLELWYQPLVALRDGSTIGAEALLRWRHPHLGLLTPDRFILIAEETGFIVPIGRWVIEQAANCAKQWNQNRAVPLRVAVNVSTRQFLTDDVAAFVRKTLNCTGCHPHWLGIEVTESLLLEDNDSVQRTIHDLHDIGVQISIDDFGTGYSALNYLRKFDVNCLKIDRQFVRDVDSDPRQAELVKAFISIARALKLNVVAEGVEVPEQAAFLLENGCEVGQGFLYCRPVPAEQFTQNLLNEQGALASRPELAPE